MQSEKQWSARDVDDADDGGHESVCGIRQEARMKNGKAAHAYTSMRVGEMMGESDSRVDWTLETREARINSLRSRGELLFCDIECFSRLNTSFFVTRAGQLNEGGFFLF